MIKGLKIIALSSFVALAACASAPKGPDPNKEVNLARTPIGLYVEQVSVGPSGMIYSDITVRNNSGKFIANLYVEVFAYDGETRVGMTNHIFSSVNSGETMITRNPVNSGGRQWNSFKYTYNIR